MYHRLTYQFSMFLISAAGFHVLAKAVKHSLLGLFLCLSIRDMEIRLSGF